MAVDTPVLERNTDVKNNGRAYSSRFDILAEEAHNARIRDTYQRLINPDNKIEDVLNNAKTDEPKAEQPKAVAAAPVAEEPYLVRDARADASIFRADSAINARREEVVGEATVAAAPAEVSEEENEDLRPTSTTIQYRTVGVAARQVRETSTATEAKRFVFGKKEKIIVAVFVAVVIALLTVVIINATVISGLNADIARVQDSITTVRGALAGVNSTVEEIIYNGISH